MDNVFFISVSVVMYITFYTALDTLVNQKSKDMSNCIEKGYEYIDGDCVKPPITKEEK